MTNINWNDVLSTLGSTSIVVAAFGFLAQTVIKHLLNRDLNTHKSELKAQTDEELAAMKASADRELQAQKAEFERQLESFKTELAAQTALKNRIRLEVSRWANPINGSVKELRKRLDNILDKKGYLALSKQYKQKINPNWSIDYEYFFGSTLFLFCQYFCWVRLLEEKLSFEMFEEQTEKDAFFDKVRAVGRKLSAFPLRGLEKASGDGDKQVFTLQQRAIGEVVSVLENESWRCMRYSDFVKKWNDGSLSHFLAPLQEFLDELTPKEELRWERLVQMQKALKDLELECVQLLSNKSN
ncbi:hypothetical protein ABVF61_05940 [Roseibium sp. HPY-6]|uniref:hypothetical protein n=1 Tax=Roseibium sp. HPY-6 TaxID=3229852 RepID=UPI00338DAC1C